MSLATLARKTRTKKRMNTRGKFILNMTGRGNVLGMNAKMSRGNCGGKLTNCAGKRAACCVGVGGESDCCRFPHGGKPAPQMGYGVYLNRKSKGAYHPGGGPQCCTKPNTTSGKIVWKQHSNLDASVVITNKKDNVLACNSDVYTAKRDTCTGCATNCDDPNYSLTVGSDANATFNFAGVTDYPMNIVTGSISSTTLVGADINWMGYQVGGNFNNIFTIALDASNIPQDIFSSITFVNCNDNSMRTYNTVDASYNANGLWSGLASTLNMTIWNWTEPITQGGFTGFLNGVTGTVDSAEQQWWADMAGVTLVTTPSASPGGIPTIVGSQTTLQVYIDNPNPNLCCCKCCPVKKNICGCRATDLVRYTRINKSFGCQTTKAIRQGRSASEQIARNRAKVDCIKPMHRTIYMTINLSNVLSFDGCCGNQCLIPGQQYTFVINNLYTSSYHFNITWCTGITNTFTATKELVTSVSFTVPKFNTSSNCIAPTHASIEDTNLTLDYCKQAFKKPQMLGSCSGR
jgi:hypothetical protein